MGDENNCTFDLPVLLRAGKLDIRRVARSNLSPSAGDYFDLLDKFINYAPEAIATLNRIAALDGDETDFKKMAGIETMLDGIGYNYFFPVIEDIISAGKRGHNGFAAECVKKIIDGFQNLYADITAARKIEKQEAPPAGAQNGSDSADENNAASYRDYSLKKVLKLLDNEEAARKLRILAVDDAPVMLKTISAILSDEYKVYGMTDPTLLEKFLTQITPELFLLDYQMPQRSGFDLIPIIRSYEEHKNTPIIFLTSLGTTDHVSAALTLGAVDFIVKPFQGNILREKVAKHIVRKKLF